MARLARLIGLAGGWVFLALALCLLGLAGAEAAVPYRVMGQPTLAGTTLASRCAGANARFNFFNNGGFEMFGPTGIAVDPRGRFFAGDYGGRRVLTWPNFESYAACQAADAVIGSGLLEGPEAVVYDTKSESLFVADTLSHTVRGFRRSGATWNLFVTLGASGVPGAAMNRFNFPRGLAVDPGGRLFVADDSNHRILIFDAPFANGEEAADSIGAGANGGFANPKGVAMIGNTLFVADFFNNRVLRFTGPFVTPAQVYVASRIFTGLNHPVDLAAHPDGSLLVTDQGNQRIARYNDAAFANSAAAPNSTFADNMGPEPLGVAADRRGRIYIADYRRYRILIRDEFVKTSPVTVGGTAGARALLVDLNQRGGRAVDRVALGQQLITWEYGPKSDPNAWYGDWRQLQQAGLRLPEVMGGEMSDLMTYPGFNANTDALNELIRHGKAGHMVTINWHPSNPVVGGNFGTPIATAQLLAMVNDGTQTGQRWQTQLNRAAAVLQKFETAGVPVLFRPLHEQNGDFFWWGQNGATGAAMRARQQAWVRMWRDMVTEMSVRKGLKNLIFVFGTNQVNYDGVVPPLTFYPGAGWADVVSIDIYDEQLDFGGSQRGQQHYAALIGTSKPFGLAEFGQSFGDNGTGPGGANWDARILAQRVRDSFPRTAFAIAWYSSVEGVPPQAYVFALPDVSFTPQLLNDPLIDTQ